MISIIKLAIRNILMKPLSSSLSAILFAISIIIIILLSIVSHQLNDKFSKNRKKVHLVVGAPGSRMDLILSSVYHISPPVQNIKIKDVKFILNNKAVSVVPLALGDHYAIDPDPSNNSFEDVEQRRIVGTDSTYLSLYDVKVEKGRLWKDNMEVTIGHEVHTLGLDIGDTFTGVHGVGGHGGHVHEDQIYTVVGIMKASGTVLDQLILCSVESVWAVHEEGHGHENTPKTINLSQKEYAPEYQKIVSTTLTPSQSDSLRNLIKTKISNLQNLSKSIHYPEGESGKQKLRLDILRMRSNIQSIAESYHLLASDEVYKNQTEFDSVLSVKDSFHLSFSSDISRLDDLLKNLQTTNNTYWNYRYAKDLERITYDLINGFNRVQHDSIVQTRRKQMGGMNALRHIHYLNDYPDNEITSLLITFKGGKGLDIQRNIVEHHPELNAALVEVEVQKLYELIEPGVEYIRMLAYLIMVISGLSVFFSLIKTLRERKYELALMRVMGATKMKVFALVIFEGIVLAFLGFALGFVLSHLIAEIMADVLKDRYHYNFTGFIFLKSELYVLIGTIGIGFVAAIVPAIMAIFTNITETLSSK